MKVKFILAKNAAVFLLAKVLHFYLGHFTFFCYLPSTCCPETFKKFKHRPSKMEMLLGLVHFL